MTFGARTIGNNPARRFLFPAPNGAATAPTFEIQVPIVRDGTLRNFFVRWRLPGGGAVVLTYIVRVNAVDTVLLASAPANDPARVASNIVDTIAVLRGDFASIAIDRPAPVGTPRDVAASLELAP